MYKFIDEGGEHLHTLDEKPLLGTSTIVGVISKPLTYWASGLAVAKFGWINSKIREDGKYIKVPEEQRIEAIKPHLEAIRGMGEYEFLELCDEAYNAHAKTLKSSAVSGTDLHAELERYVKNTIAGHMGQYDDKIMPFITWCNENVDEFLWSEIHCYSEKMWVGGISDCGVKLKDGKIGIIDFKSSKESYQSQFIQCAGYDLQIAENGGLDKDGNKIYTLEKPIEFYAIVPFGASKFTVDMRYNVDGLKEGFKSCVVLYKLNNI